MAQGLKGPKRIFLLSNGLYHLPVPPALWPPGHARRHIAKVSVEQR